MHRPTIRSPSLLLLALAAAACDGGPEIRSDSTESTACRTPPDSLVTTLETRNRHFGGVGGAATVRVRGKRTFSRGFGMADLEHGVPVSASDSRFQVASVTKAVTAAAALKLHEEGRLDLDAPVGRYVPDFPDPEGGVGGGPSVRLLAGHLGGVRHYRPNERDANFFAAHFDDPFDALSLFSDRPYAHPPGRSFLYSSYGYNVIAAVVDRITMRPYETFVRDEIFDPLGMDRTRFDDARYPMEGRVRGYTYYFPWFSFETTERLMRAPRLDLSYNRGGGNIVSTAEDLARFGEAFLQPGFLRASSLELVRTPVRSDDVTSSWGFGWQLAGGDGDAAGVLTAQGSVPGFQATVRVEPARAVVSVLLLNSWGKRPEEAPPLEDPPAWLADACAPEGAG